MLAYLIVIFLSIFLYTIALTNRRNRRHYRFFTFLSILIPSLLAGFRNVIVGTDTWFYAEGMFHDAVASHKFLEYAEETRGESIYALINYIVSLFTDQLWVLLFVVQFITLYFVYAFIRKNLRTKASILALIIYYFIFYNMSFNLIRQSIAITLLLYSFGYLLRGEMKKYFFTSGINMFVHTSSIIGSFLLAVIYQVFSSKNNNKVKQLVLLSSMIVSILIFKSYFDVILEFIVSNLTLFAKYKFYSTDYQGSGTNLTEILIRIFFFSFTVIFLWLIDKKYKIVIFAYMFVAIVDILLLSLSSVSQWIFRIAFYMSILHVYFLPFLISHIRLKSLRWLFSITLVLSVISFWGWLIVYKGVNATIPYKSDILSIE